MNKLPKKSSLNKLKWSEDSSLPCIVNEKCKSLSRDAGGSRLSDETQDSVFMPINSSRNVTRSSPPFLSRIREGSLDQHVKKEKTIIDNQDIIFIFGLKKEVPSRTSRLSVTSSSNDYFSGDKRGSLSDNLDHIQNELEKCRKIKTKYAEVSI